MKITRSASFLVTASILALAGLGLAGAAQAGNDVYWSVGVASPGVQVGVSNAQQVFYQPTYVQHPPAYVQHAPVYVQRQPGYMPHQPVYVQPYPVYVAPQPVVYVRPAPVYVAPTYYGQPRYVPNHWQRPGPGWRHGHRHSAQQRYESNQFNGGRSGDDHRGRR